MNIFLLTLHSGCNKIIFKFSYFSKFETTRYPFISNNLKSPVTNPYSIPDEH